MPYHWRNEKLVWDKEGLLLASDHFTREGKLRKRKRVATT